MLDARPVGGPVGGDVPSVAVTIHGEGFADFGGMLSLGLGLGLALALALALTLTLTLTLTTNQGRGLGGGRWREEHGRDDLGRDHTGGRYREIWGICTGCIGGTSDADRSGEIVQEGAA